ncbi:hypothetical protein RB595_007645 [Gaeumannomyces hyphopodioides]
MSYIQQKFTQVALLVDELQVLYEEYEAEKRDRDAPFQQRQSELEIELKTLKQDREAASKEVEQKYKPKFDKLTWFIPQPQPDQAAEPPASPNVGPGVRGGRNTGDRLSSDDGSAHDDGSEDDDDGSGHDDGSDYSDDQPVDNDNEPADNDYGSDRSDGESEDNDGESEDNDNSSAHNHDEPTSAASVSPRALRKRRLTAKARSDLERPNKRRRRGGKAASSGSARVRRVGEAASDRTGKTVSFEDVRGKHRIVSWPAASGHFYILWCKDHGKIFNSKDPVQGAGKHLSKSHGMTGTHENAIKELGFRVQNCTQEQVDESNRAVDQHNRAVDQPQQRPASDPKTSIQPISGGFYQVYWHAGAKTRSGTRSGTPFVALCLPTDSFDAVGILGSIHDTGLVHSIPKCYRTHTRTNRILGWNEDYQDGGTKASQRKFPFLFFTGDVQLPSEGKLSIPKKGKVLSWVAANDIQPLDLNDSTTSYLPGHATALAFASRLLHQHEFGDQSQAESSQEALALMASASLLASSFETSRRSANAEQAAADTSRSEPKPAPSNRANNSANSAPAALDTIVQGPDPQLDENADTAQNGLTSMTQLPSNSKDSRPSSEDNRPKPEDSRPSSDSRPSPEDGRPSPEDGRPSPEDGRPSPEDGRPSPEDGRPSPEDGRPSPEDGRPSPEDGRPSPEDSRPSFENNKPRPEDNRQDIRAGVVVGASQFKPVSDGGGRDLKAGRGSLSFILGKSNAEG